MTLFPIAPPLPIPRFTTNHFYVEVGLALTAVFHECSGLGVDLKSEAVKDGGNNVEKRYLPMGIDCKEVTLKYGVVLLDQIWSWFEDALNGRPERKTVTIHQYMNNGMLPGGIPMVSWRLNDCLPTGWTGPSYKSNEKSQVACDAIKFRPSSLERI